MLRYKLEGHTSKVESVAVSVDSKLIVTSVEHEVVKFWDAKTGLFLYDVERSEPCGMYASDLDFSKDGQWLLGTDFFGMKYWKLSDEGKPKQHLLLSLNHLEIAINIMVGPGGDRPERMIPDSYCTTAIRFSPDGNRVACNYLGEKVGIWRAHTSEVLRIFRKHRNFRVKCIAWFPDSKLVASGGYDNATLVWDADTGTLVTEPLRGHTAAVNGIVISSKASFLASASDDKTVMVWDVRDLLNVTVMHTLEGHAGVVSGIALSPDDRCLASCSTDMSVRVWDAVTGHLIRTLEGHTHAVNCVVWSPDGDFVVSGSDDKTACMWEVEAEVCPHVYVCHNEVVSSMHACMRARIIFLWKEGQRSVYVGVQRQCNRFIHACRWG